MEDRVTMLLNSYGLEELLEDNDLTEEFVLGLLVDLGYIEMERYFDDD
jgi:hypothetical protein